MELSDIISQQLLITDIAEEFDIELQRCHSGKFSHKCKCPNIDHKGGAERTPSCYISEETNSFHCFGCGAGSKSLNFYMLCANLSFKDAISELKDRVDLEGNFKPIKKRSSNLGILLQISDIIRKHIYNNIDDLDKIMILSEKIDKKISEMDPYDIKGACSLLKGVNKALDKLKK